MLQIEMERNGMSWTSKEVRLIRRPEPGIPAPEDFAVVSVDVGAPGPGELVVRNEWMSVDPSMRNRMNDIASYIEPFELDRAMNAGAVGTVVASSVASVPAGAAVRHQLGWREYATVAADEVEIIDATQADLTQYLNVLSYIGLTAYAGLTRIAEVKAGETIFVSGAAGAVGSLVGMMARALGAKTIIGSAGGAHKTAALTSDFGYDFGLDYKAGHMGRQLAEVAPDGIDIYFDNVGGDQLVSALSALRNHGRVVLCGAVSAYNAAERPAGPSNLALAISKRLSLRGFIVFDHDDLMERYLAQATQWLTNGELRPQQTLRYGIDNALGALLDMLRGENIGKMLVDFTDRT
jgi:NADPH-dependent curcumin reductase CurA